MALNFKTIGKGVKNIAGTFADIAGGVASAAGGAAATATNGVTKASKVGSTILDTFTTPNFSVEEGGGLTSKLIPRVLNGPGLAVVGIGMVGANLGAGFVGDNFENVRNTALGPSNYAGMAKMTHSTAHTAEDMYRLSGGNYQVFADMASNTLSTSRVLDNYGADSNLIRAMYGMH